MKKLFLSALTLCAFTATTYAQTPDLKLGAKGGINYSNIKGYQFKEEGKKGDNLKGDFSLGYNIGVLAEIFINEKFSIQPEILYSTQGFKKTVEGIEGTKKTITTNINYINIPIIAKYYIYEGLNIQAGPQVGVYVNHSKKLKFNKDTPLLKEIEKEFNKKTTEEPSNFNSVDFGLGWGLGYEFPIGLFIDARYNLGLTNMFKEKIKIEGEKIKTNLNAKNHVMQLSIGFKF